MSGINPKVIVHQLSSNALSKLVKQNKRQFALKRQKVIEEEVDKLLKAWIISEIDYPEWNSNVVIVKKSNGSGVYVSTSPTLIEVVQKIVILSPELISL